MAGNDIQDISFFKHLQHHPVLRRLSLGYNPIVDVSPLQHLISLKELYLVSTSVKDISSLYTLHQLESCRVDIPPLSYPPIWYIYLKTKGGKLGDYANLQKLPHVEKIWKLLMSEEEENLELAQQLAEGQGWSKEDFEVYEEFSEDYFELN